MASSKRMISIGSALACLLMGSVQTDTALAAERPDFSGSWKLNAELSGNPRDKMMEQMKNRVDGSGRLRGEGGFSDSGEGARGGGIRGGGMEGGGNQEGIQERLKVMTARFQSIEIAHQDPLLHLRFADGRERTIYTDGRTVEDDFESGIFEAKGKWKGDSQVVVKAESTYGGKLTETYELSVDGQQLTVTTKMGGDGRRPNLTFRRVYEKALIVATSGDADGN